MKIEKSLKETFAGKLSTLSKITDTGDGFFECKNISSAAMFICVQTNKIIPFARSIVAKSGRILAVTGQDQISKSSSIHKPIKLLSREVRKTEELTVHTGILDNTEILHVPIVCPTTKIRWDWFIEVQDADKYKTAATLLSKHFSKGLLHLYRKRSYTKLLKPLFSLPLLSITAFIVACFYVEIPEKVIAPVIVKSIHTESARSSTEGLVLTCLPEGREVSKGDIIAKLDVSEYEQKLKETLKGLSELTLKIDKATKDSLADTSKLVEIQLLKNEEVKLNLKIKYLESKISKDVIRAPISGVIRYLPDISRDGDVNTGRYLHKGESLCFIDDKSKKIAEINISESDIHVIPEIKGVYMYYHSNPTEPIITDIIKVPEHPEVNELTKKYVYPLQASTNAPIGITGTAHLQGEDVKLGYFLFKKAYFYFRGF